MPNLKRVGVHVIIDTLKSEHVAIEKFTEKILGMLLLRDLAKAHPYTLALCAFTRA